MWHPHIPELPPPSEIPDLEPEELAGPLLAYVRSQTKGHSRGTVHLGNVCRVFSHRPEDATYDVRTVERALSAAWSVLERTGMVAVDPEQAHYAVYFVTKRGAAASVTEWSQVVLAASIPPEMFHRELRTTVYAKFLRGDHEGALLEAFRLVEVRVREAGSFGPTDLGVPLMRKAFQTASGPLTDPGEVMAEQQALSDLYAGAIGRFKNPPSHRLTSPDAAPTARLLSFASYLLTLLESRPIK